MDVEHQSLSVPLMAHLEVTNICNHRCLHCYKLDSEIQNRPNDIVSDDVIINNVYKLIKGGILQIIITGGEPLLKKNLVKQIINIANENNVSVSINTNLTVADDDIINFLSLTKTRILTSCPSGIPDSFEKLTITKNFSIFEQNLQKVIKAGIKTTVNMVVTKDNLSEIRQTAIKIKDLGCTSFCTTPVALNMDYPRFDLLLSQLDIEKIIRDILWIEKTLDMKVDILDGLPKCVFPKDILQEEHQFLYRRCQAGRTFIAVSPQGDIRPCANTNYSYGNLQGQSLKEIWEKMTMWRSEMIVPTECKGCTWINRCLGGCRTNAKVLTNEWNGTDIWKPCPITTEPPSHAKKVVLGENSVLTISNNIKIRKESDGRFLVYSIKNRTFCMMNENMLDLILLIQSLKSISYKNLIEQYSLNNNLSQVETILTILIQYKIIKII